MLRVAVVLCLVGAALSGPPVSRSRSEIEKFRTFLESTRTEQGVILDHRVAANPEGSVWENSGKYQGDILLDDQDVESMVEQFAKGRMAYMRPNTRWPARTVVYEFAAGHFDNAQRNHVVNSMRLLESRVCIRFRHRNPGEFSHVLLTTNPTGCYATLGFAATRGVHVMNLARNAPGRGCFNTVVIIHEWMHILGFVHMQSTYNRDWYVRINWPNIVRGMEYNFYRFDNNLVSNLGLPYEHGSCMHYGTHAFSANGRPTIDALRPHEGTMGQTTHVTGFDLWRISRHYGCDPWRKLENFQPIYSDEIITEEELANEKVTVEEFAEEEVDNVEVANEKVALKR